jgi:solute carrier family 25 protein 39/40
MRNHLAALYKGLGPTLWRDVPFSAIYWVGVETLKTDVFHFHRHESSSVLNHMASSFASGALSGMIAATCTTPFDVIKTRSQVASSSPTWKTKKLYPEPDFICSHHQGRESYFYPSERNIFYQLRHIAKMEGLSTLWRGNVARVLKIGPACAIMLTSYEYSKSIISGMQ